MQFYHIVGAKAMFCTEYGIHMYPFSRELRIQLANCGMMAERYFFQLWEGEEALTFQGGHSIIVNKLTIKTTEGTQI